MSDLFTKKEKKKKKTKFQKLFVFIHNNELDKNAEKR